MRTSFPPQNCFGISLNNIFPLSSSSISSSASLLWSNPAMVEEPLSGTMPRALSQQGQGQRVPAGASVSSALLKCAIAQNQRGCCLSPEDISGLRQLVQKILLEGVLPSLEAKVFSLLSTVGKARSSRLTKAWSWLGGGGSSGPSSAAGLGMAVADRALSALSGSTPSSAHVASLPTVNVGEDTIIVGFIPLPKWLEK